MTLRDRDALRTAANIVGVLLLIGVVAPFVVYGAPQVVGADHGFVVLSGSMEPEMSPGDAVIVRDASPDSITRGDVITFGTDGETPTTHRVIEVVERDGSAAYVTKGDANEDPDAGTVPHERVIGEVILVIPVIGYVVQFVNTPVGFAAVVVVPMGLFVISELWSLVRSVEGDGGSSRGGGGGDTHIADGGASAADERSHAHGIGEPTSHAHGIREGTVEHTAASPATGGETSTGSDTGSSLTLTRSSLQLLSFVFGVYVPYSAYVAYTTVEAWSITVAVATGIGFLFCVGLYVGSGRTLDGGTEGERDAPAVGSEVERDAPEVGSATPSSADVQAVEAGDPAADGGTDAADASAPSPSGDARSETGTDAGSTTLTRTPGSDLDRNDDPTGGGSDA
ncbi:signal peptidase I [Halobellus sp. GM3]|uniref:signal peptidase I n=1 Tax=Halobellus sp. GM3 TaxID=3458410 RepID=UPI00403D96D8